MTGRLKVGIVGAGIGAQHAAGLAALPDLFEIDAIADLDTARAGAVAAEHGIGHVLTSMEALLDRDLDVVHVCTPPWLHLPHTLAALAAGKHVVVEKPTACALSEIEALEAAEANAGRRICPVFQYRFGHGYQKLRHLMAKGVAGPAVIATAETHWYRDAEYYAAAAWRGTFDRELGGCLTSHAIHIHDLLCEALGWPVSVHARASRRLNGNETEDTAVLSLAFDSGAFATSSVTLGSRQQTSRLRFCFRDLVAESCLEPYAPGTDPWTFPHDDPAAAKRIDEALADFMPLPEGFAGQFHRLHAALVGDAPLPVTLADARRSIELLTAAYRSALTGEAEPLPIAADHPFHGGWRDGMKAAWT